MILSKLSKKKKIILSLLGIGVLTTSITIPILVLNNDKKNNQLQEKTKEDIKPNIRKLKVNLPSTATLKGSKIKNGYGGTIFHDEFKNLWSMGYESKLEVLKANEDSSGYVETGWTNNRKKEPLLRNSNIKDATRGVIFQDKFKNLWSMGWNTKLQVLKKDPNKKGYVDIGWTNDTSSGLLKGSNINKGSQGVIFQDKFKNLWAMGKNQKLQVLKVNQDGTNYDINKGWVNNNDPSSGDELLKGSKITNGSGGTIFQDKFNNLWAMGRDSKLQVLKANKNGYVNSGWTNNNLTSGDNLLRGSNITNGYSGAIFQDEFKNLWIAGGNDDDSLNFQVLKANKDGDGYVETGWVKNNDPSSGDELLRGSKIVKAWGTIIFQDKFKNLWSMGWNSKLQVLEVNSNDNGYVSSWTNNENNNGLLKNSNIIDFQYLSSRGRNGTIFQDKFKNLWTMSSNFRLQVLKVNEKGNGYVNSWVNNNDPINGDKLLKNSKIKNSALTEEALSEPWINDYGIIYQDKFSNLWATGSGNKLQVLKANLKKDGYVESWEVL